MDSITVDANGMEWASGTPLFGPGCNYEGRDLVQLKVLSDRRQQGGGVAYLMRFVPPPGKVIKIIAVARSDEHAFSLKGGRGTTHGEQLRFPGSYWLNPKGKVHSAVIGTETTALVVYTGAPDEVRSIEVVEPA